MSKKVAVVGCFMMDLSSQVEKLPKPGETIKAKSFQMAPGGKGSNQAIAAARLGADVTFVTKIGKDVIGEMAMDVFKGDDMNTDYVAVDPEKGTGTTLNPVDDTGENFVITHAAAGQNMTREDVYKAEDNIAEADVMLLQLEANQEAQDAAYEIAEKHNVPIILNPAPYSDVDDSVLSKLSYFTPNETEASAASGIEVTSVETAKEAAEALYNKGINNVIITLGSEGCLIFNDEYKGEIVPAYKVNAVDTTGAGDAWNGGFAYALVNGHDILTAAKYGNAAGGLSTEKFGAAISNPQLEDVEKLVNG